MPETPHRPRLINLLTIAGVIQGAVGLLLGLFLVLDRDDADLLKTINDNDAVGEHQITSNLLLTVGALAIVVGLVLLVSAFAVRDGNPVARDVFAVLSVLMGSMALYSLVAVHGEQQFSAALNLGFSVFVLWFLFKDEETKAFFGDTTPSS